MATVTEKIEAILQEAWPKWESIVEQQPISAQMAIAALSPFVERKISEQIARDPAELDDAIAGAIDFLGRLRSDDATDLIVTGRGASFAPLGIPSIAFGDPVRATGVVGGPDEMRQVDAGAADVPVGSGAAVGD